MKPPLDIFDKNSIVNPVPEQTGPNSAPLAPLMNNESATKKNLGIFISNILNISGFIILALVVIGVISLRFAGKYLENQKIVGNIINLLIRYNLSSKISITKGWYTNIHFRFLAFVALAGLLLIISAFVIRKTLPKQDEGSIQSYILNLSQIILNIFIIALVTQSFLAMLLASYINHSFSLVLPAENHSKAYATTLSKIENHLQDGAAAAQITFSKIMSNIKNNNIILDELSDTDYIDLAETLCYLADLKGGIFNSEEHYLRNMFSRAPATLSNMTDTILNNPGDPYKWKLLKPSQTLYHMMGKDGEFNLKFISSDGHFEAVYNKDGILLLQNDDPVNMGTFNYASPLATPLKHRKYDVLTYEKWNNAPKMGKVPKNEAEVNKEKFQSNHKARANYQRYRDMLDKK